MKMVLYSKVVDAASTTAEKLCNSAMVTGGTPWSISTKTNGGVTASIQFDSRRRQAAMRLPSMAPTSRLTIAEADRIVGLIAHECCHVRHTEWSEWQKAVAAGHKVKTLTNGIEDVRIEAKELSRADLPNLRNVLAAMVNNYLWTAVTERAAKGQPPVGSLPGDMAYLLCVLGRLQNGYNLPAATGLIDNVPATLRPIVDDALNAIPKLRTTRAARMLAERIAAALTALEPAAPPPPPPPPPGDSPQDGTSEAEAAQDGQDSPQDGQDAPQAPQDGQDGQDSPQDGQDGQDGQDAPQAPQDGQDGQDGQDSPQDGQDGQDGQDSPGTGSGEKTDGPGEDAFQPPANAPRELDPGADTVADTVREAAARNGDGCNRDWSELNNARERMQRRRFCYVGSDSNLARHVQRWRDLLPNPARLRADVARMVRSEERVGQDRFRTSGRMDRRALARIAADSVNVFTRRTRVAGVDTAVLLLVDGSGSMDDYVDLTRTFVYHVATAIDMARGKCAVAEFIGCGAIYQLNMVKNWNEKIDPRRIVMISGTQYTPLSAAIATGGPNVLDEIVADRKIMLVLTDGDCDMGTLATREAIKMAEARGVEVVGIGFGVTLAGRFPIYVDVPHSTALVTGGLGVLAKALEHGPAARR